jgi:hypothetical protein
MKQFVLIFRMDVSAAAQPSSLQMQEYMMQWNDWINEISGTDNKVAGGNHLSVISAKVVYPEGKITDGPYTVNKESVAGYILIDAKNLDAAISIAQKCPILNGEGNSVEVRETASQ